MLNKAGQMQARMRLMEQPPITRTLIGHWLLEVTNELIKLQDDFSGAGLIFYNAKSGLPIVPLNPKRHRSVPTSNIDSAKALLREISNKHSEYHDGFHLVDYASLSITEISCFFSPPIVPLPTDISTQSEMGARTMASLLGSGISQIPLIATITLSGSFVFDNLKAHPLKSWMVE